MKDTPTLPDTKPSALDYIKQSALEYIINYLFDGLEACERNPATDDFELGYEQALHDTMVDLLLCHMPCKSPSLPTCGPNGPSGFLGEPLVSREGQRSQKLPRESGVGRRQTLAAHRFPMRSPCAAFFFQR
jgi:hypothetical protein